jgi:hypothetical protein
MHMHVLSISKMSVSRIKERPIPPGNVSFLLDGGFGSFRCCSSSEPQGDIYSVQFSTVAPAVCCSSSGVISFKAAGLLISHIPGGMTSLVSGLPYSARRFSTKALSAKSVPIAYAPFIALHEMKGAIRPAT